MPLAQGGQVSNEVLLRTINLGSGAMTDESNVTPVTDGFLDGTSKRVQSSRKEQDLIDRFTLDQSIKILIQGCMVSRGPELKRVAILREKFQCRNETSVIPF